MSFDYEALKGNLVSIAYELFRFQRVCLTGKFAQF